MWLGYRIRRGIEEAGLSVSSDGFRNDLESFVSESAVSSSCCENAVLVRGNSAWSNGQTKVLTPAGLGLFRPTWAEVNLKLLKENVKELVSLTAPGAVMMAVVKASAYGHGAVPVAKACLEAGAKWLGVALLEEALELRRAGITSPILVLGAVPSEGMEVAIKDEVSFTVFTADHVKQAAQAAGRVGKRARVHLKVETGMGRIGARPGAELETLAVAFRHSPEVLLEGTFTHFACADAPDKSYTEMQFAVFREALEILSREGLDPGIRHCANSAATIDLPETHLDMVRPGLSLYGYLPSERTLRKAHLTPCLEWKTQIVHLKRVPAGTAISYGSTYVAPRETAIATVPVGYADGYPRALSNRGEALFRGRRVRIAGRVCMDQMMLDLGPDACGLVEVLESGKTNKKGGDPDRRGLDAGAHPDLTVTLLGSQGDDAITADEMARLIDTIPHEILTGIGSRVRRVHIEA